MIGVNNKETICEYQLFYVSHSITMLATALCQSEKKLKQDYLNLSNGWPLKHCTHGAEYKLTVNSLSLKYRKIGSKPLTSSPYTIK